MPQVKLTRPQIAAFVQDPRAVREIEKLFSIVSEQSTTGTDAIEIAAGNAQATADEAVGLALQAAQEAAINAGTADAKAANALSVLNRLSDAVALLALAPPRVDDRRTRYGTFYDTTTQTQTAINTAKAITFNTTDLSLGVNTGTPTSRIVVDTPGIYNFQFSAQVDKIAGGVGRIWMWARVNGVDVSNSAGEIYIANSHAQAIPAWNYVLKLNAGDYFELMWSVDDVSIILLAAAASAPVPGIPSVILTVTDNISA